MPVDIGRLSQSLFAVSAGWVVSQEMDFSRLQRTIFLAGGVTAKYVISDIQSGNAFSCEVNF